MKLLQHAAKSAQISSLVTPASFEQKPLTDDGEHQYAKKDV